ncbi:hypothetical protein JOC75_000454 [Metabacillus crassostreae]|uniref:DUF4825 domain-containing protein n=1 Tax=Metabacillus crassostreae TaxID=929098 RepID=UPI001EF94209|nr:DUF4825 domain-containing protein [Metabacillus crassostreae]MBM7602484.1 hypothetical protein [Metabacillus crassostreae]
MRKVKGMLSSLFVLFLLNGCNTNNVDIFQYKNSYVGDNSAVSDILNFLPSKNQLEGFELETKEKPYGIIIHYHLEIEEGYEQTVLYNSTYLFSLIQNAELIKFDFEGMEYEMTKEKLEKWYGRDLNEFNNKEELDDFIQDQLKDQDKVKQLFN